MTQQKLFWSRKGEIACLQHAPSGDHNRWTAEGWQEIAHSPGRRVKYQCQHCQQRAIQHTTLRVTPPPLILNVDDHPAKLYARDRVLRLHGFNVANAETGRGALEVARQLRPSLILLDVHLPDIDGRMVCRELKDDTEVGHIPVVLISSTLRASAPQREYERNGARADAFIAEPVEPEVLATTLRRMLGEGA